MAVKYWEILLTSWRAQGRNGFSIPFILGSQKYLPPTHEEQGIEELIMDIVNQDNVEVLVNYCPDINKIILGIRDETKEAIPGIFPSIKKGNQDSFFRTNFVNDLGDDVESIIAELIKRFQGNIDRGEFSVLDGEKGEMGDFTVAEIEFIKNCFTIYRKLNG